MGRGRGAGYIIAKAAKHGGVGWCRGDDTAKVAIMGSVGRCEGNGELTICAKLAKAPADHLLRWEAVFSFSFCVEEKPRSLIVSSIPAGGVVVVRLFSFSFYVEEKPRSVIVSSIPAGGTVHGRQ